MGPKTRFHSLLEVKINEQVQMKSASLIAGAANSYEGYREIVGYVSGLLDALKLANDVEEDMDA